MVAVSVLGLNPILIPDGITTPLKLVELASVVVAFRPHREAGRGADVSECDPVFEWFSI